MADEEYVAILKKGVVDAWNKWRDEHPHAFLDLDEAHLSAQNLGGANLGGANLRRADLSGANLVKANLSVAFFSQADLSQADLSGANLGGANLKRADLTRANLVKANLYAANLHKADLIGANLSGANLSGAHLAAAVLNGADLGLANLSQADLSGANLGGACLRKANLSGANLSGANLQGAELSDTDFSGADLTGCRVHGVSAWGLKLEGTKQQNLVITLENEPKVTVDNIEIAQFIYLMLNNQKIRHVIDSITSKAVLILGRFTAERKKVLDALREELRKRDYLPILFDFDVPERRNLTETVTLLARMARFIIADLTDPSSIPQELQAIIPSVRVPVQPLLLEGSSLYSMFKDFDPQDFHWVLPVYQYKEPEQLLSTLAENVIAPAEGKVRALEERRRMIEAELTKPR
jgi:uncharacterized protein YjbI with pentapeptide repeats